MGAVSQRAAKLLAVKVEGLKKSADLAIIAELCTWCNLGSSLFGYNHSESLMVGNFEAL